MKRSFTVAMDGDAQVMDNKSDTDFTPRDFQVELLQKALEKNIIVCSGTGTGKTFISVLLIKELQHELMAPYQDGGMRTLFISNTVPLVTQQAEVLTNQLCLNVGKYTGDMGIDFWSKETWEKEFIANQVLVMTSQILVNLLSLPIIKPNQINLLIVDECHHAVGGSPMTQVMRRLKDFKASPKILGLTASVLNGKCKLDQVEEKIRQLEITLGAVIETPSEKASAEAFATDPNERSVCFNSINPCAAIVWKIVMELNKVLKEITVEKPEEAFKIDNDNWFLMQMYESNVKLSHIVQDLEYVLGALGIWCAREVINMLLVELKRVEENQLEEPSDNLKMVQDILNTIKGRCDELFNQQALDDPETIVFFTSSKVEKLLEVLKEIGGTEEGQMETENENGNSKMKSMKGIVFVERRIAAWMLSHLLNKFAELKSEYAFLKTLPIVGHGADPTRYKYACMKNREQQEKLLQFRMGKCNLLIATRVVEEGMDIPTCNLIVRFDSPKDYRSYVQSKGRARSIDSQYILLLDKCEKELVLADICLYDKIEKTLYTICHDRRLPTEEESTQKFNKWILPSYYSEGIDGPCVSSVDAIQRVNWYCQLLPKDQLTTLSPVLLYKKEIIQMNLDDIAALEDLDPFQEAFDFYDDFDEIDLVDKGFFYDLDVSTKQHYPDENAALFYKCAIKLPLNSPIRDPIVGEFMPNKKLAKQSVALKVVEKLHKAGELNNDLLPIHKNPTEFLKQFINIEEERVEKGFPVPGSKKRRQKYTKEVASVLKNSAPVAGFHLYKIQIVSKPNRHSQQQNADTSNNRVITKNKCFGIVISKRLEKYMEPFPLYSKNENIWVTIRLVRCTQRILTAMELDTLKKFQVLLFEKILKIKSGIFTPLQHSSSYMIAPIQEVKSEFSLDWEMMTKLDCFNYSSALPDDNERQHFVFHEDDFNDSVLTPLYDESKEFRLYTVNRIEPNSSPRTCLPDRTDSFLEYYKLRYGIKIQCLDQPLLDSQRVHLCVNLLPMKQIRSKQVLMTFNGEQRRRAEFLVPELVMIVPIPGFLLKQAVMLPSILYRLNSLCMVHELGQAIGSDHVAVEEIYPHALWSKVESACQIEAISLYKRNEKRIEAEISWNQQNKLENEEMTGGDTVCTNGIPPTSILLKAVTLNSANDVMNLERLETLGDTFLKYVTSIYLFCEYRRLDEGRLTMARSKIISNNHLYHLGKLMNVGQFVHEEIFSPHFNWVPPHVDIDKVKEDILVYAKIAFNLWSYIPDEVDLRGLTTNAIGELITTTATERGKTVILERANNIVNNYTCQMINDKSIADTIEALIGAYLLHIGPHAALKFLHWLGVKIFPTIGGGEELRELNIPRTACLKESQNVLPKLTACLDRFQMRIGYTFKDISFLVQAFTHPSYFKNLVTDCYQRLEFLGDAVLDYLVTWQIFKSHHNFDPGQISDLRSALVNNETFARLAVEKEFDGHLKEFNPKLFDSIRRFKLLLAEEKLLGKKDQSLILDGETINEEEVEVPKALGDIFESVAGAIYLDSGLSLDSVWEVYEPMLRPLLDTYSENIPINPIRELHESYSNATFRKGEVENEFGIIISKSVVEIFPGMMFEGYGKNSKLAKLAAVKTALRYTRQLQ